MIIVNGSAQENFIGLICVNLGADAAKLCTLLENLTR
jgi:hypothetical protein